MYRLFLSSITLISVIWLISCRQEPDQITEFKPNPFVSGQTESPVDPKQSINIQLKGEVKKDLDEETIKKAVTLSPSIQVMIQLIENGILSIQPQNYWQPGSHYSVKLELDLILSSDLPDPFHDHTLSFTVKKQNFTVSSQHLIIPDPSNPAEMNLSGVISTAVTADPGQIEKVLSAKLDDELSIQWEHTGNLHHFVISGIHRKEMERYLSLKWNGNSIQVDQRGEESIRIPSANEFFLLDWEMENGDQQMVTLQFSDPLDETQDLDGMIYLENYAGTIRTQIDRNIIYLYPDQKLKGEFTLHIESGITNTQNRALDKKYSEKTLWRAILPAVRFVGKGNIIPESDQILLNFEVVSLRKVHLDIYQIKEDNILQFLQVNRIDGNYQMNRVARKVYSGKVDLTELMTEPDLTKWNKFSINLAKYADFTPNSIYDVRISFRPEDAMVPCSETLQGMEQETYESPWDYPYYGPQGYYNRYWEERNDPCKPAYYQRDHFIRKNVLASNLGVIAKKSDRNDLLVVVTQLSNANPADAAEVAVYDFSMHLMNSSSTGPDGMVKFNELEEKPAFVVVRWQDDQTYLGIHEGQELPVSRFDVGGVAREDGFRCFIYGERGVWRPGDTLYLHAILDDEGGEIPPGYPMEASFYNPQGKLQSKQTITNHIGGIYPVRLSTNTTSLTGTWTIQLKVGNTRFVKNLKVETIKPNRLEVLYESPTAELIPQDRKLQFKLRSKWLHGAIASHLNTTVDYKYFPVVTRFENYRQFHFDDITRKHPTTQQTAFSGKLDQAGTAVFSVEGNFQNLKGKLGMELMTRVFEKSGDFSTSFRSFIVNPFQSYVGVHLPTNEYGVNRVDEGKLFPLEIISLDRNGKLLANRSVEVKIHKLRNYYWWESDNQRLYNYSSGNVKDAELSEQVSTDQNGKGVVRFTPKSGSYLVRVCDKLSGHCTSGVFYAGYNWYDSQEDPAANLLSLQTDKTNYELDEKITLSIPAQFSGKALIAVEQGGKVLSSFWQDIQVGENSIEILPEPEMAPHVYFSVVLLRGTLSQEKDLPIRQYGVLPVEITNPARLISPEIKVPKQVQPDHPFTIEVSEKNKLPMNYTLAIIDEGLLGLTGFNTPDPYAYFYNREALRTNTFDYYDYVIGNYGGEFGREIALGGDAHIQVERPTEINRFKPVVQVFGPYTLEKRATRKHDVQVNNYVGRLRAMVIATGEKSFGSSETDIEVKKPLMVVGTAPRILGPGETFYLPATVFAMDDKIRRAQVDLSEVSGMSQIMTKPQSVSFSQPGNKIVDFLIETPSLPTVENFVLTASSGNEKSLHTLNINIRNPNPVITNTESVLLDPNASKTISIPMPGMAGSNRASLELSTLPPIQLEQRLQYLIRYPHGCSEQITSAVFPQLYLSQFLDLDSKQILEIQQNVQDVIYRLQNFQTGNGGITTWPNTADHNEWMSSYVLHFLTLAANQAYHVPSALYTNLLRFQKNQARKWEIVRTRNGEPFPNQGSIQAYRLFTLAKAGKQEVGAMNRLKKASALSTTAKWHLAGAYAHIGRKKMAMEVIQNSPQQVNQSLGYHYTYASPLRDNAVILEVLLALDRNEDAFVLARHISDQINGSGWYSTHSLGFALHALGLLYSTLDEVDGFDAVINYQGKNQTLKSVHPVMQIEWSKQEVSDSAVFIQNTGSEPLFVQWSMSGQPLHNPGIELEQNFGHASCLSRFG